MIEDPEDFLLNEQRRMQDHKHKMELRPHEERLAKINAKASVKIARARDSDYQFVRAAIALFIMLVFLGAVIASCEVMTHDAPIPELELQQEQNRQEEKELCYSAGYTWDSNRDECETDD